ncbi:hypothetical protein K505DRAFT_362161 [Melanomma pulvis-pyrius CBS 109.77]|uniref:Uncharacterized protein n=1 Tax=Melanomma pulvis-pyrius CBS 109.77 TaxID=1314802 RepID=A0A6A6XBE1_9PLEO|nr:hypothetical protein K505DRAFT_362161 [Melanomma pulvis-pyrius CBS 109.77]
MARHLGAVSRKVTVSEAYNLGNSTPGGINVLHVIVDNMYFASDPAFSEFTDAFHDDGFFAEGLLLLIIGIVPYTQAELLRVSLLVPAGAGLLLAEYRLSVPNLAASVSAMVLAGVARALWKTVIKNHPGIVENSVNQTCQLITIEALIGVIWVMVFRTGDQIFVYDVRNAPLLAINALTSALTLTLGKSTLLHMGNDVADTSSQTVHDPTCHNWDALTLLALTGIVGCHSTLSIRRSYTNVYQFCCFIFAVLCICCKGRVDVFDVRLQKLWTIRSTHELVDVNSAPSAENNDAIGFAEESDRTGFSEFFLNSQYDRFPRFLPVLSVALLWTAYGVLNFTERPERYSPVFLDRDYVPQIPVEIVLSMYKEPVEEVTQLISNLKSMPALSDAHFTIYIKDSEANNQDIKHRTGADLVATLPNIGREGETYLNHILNKWHSLAKQTIFLQADIHNSREFFTHMNNYYRRLKTGFLSLGWSGAVCNCENCGDRLFWHDNTHFLPQTFNRMNSSAICGNVLLSYKGQFIVSAARIRGIDKDIYHGLWKAFVDEKSWAHQPEYLQGRPDSMSAPDFGYTMERTWNLLFQCSNIDVAWKCPSLVSRWRIGGDIGDCQCFDA